MMSALKAKFDVPGISTLKVFGMTDPAGVYVIVAWRTGSIEAGSLLTVTIQLPSGTTGTAMKTAVIWSASPVLQLRYNGLVVKDLADVDTRLINVEDQ